MSDADFGEGLGVGDDFWYSSMRSLPLAPLRSELRNTKLRNYSDTTCIPGNEAIGNSSWSKALSPSSDATPVVTNDLKSNLV